MARYTEAVCKLCRREGEKLFLKGSRCMSNKCAFEKKSYIPGQHGKSRRFKMSDYGVQLREKQKLRRIYGVLEKQFRIYYKNAAMMKGITGDNLLMLLESRLDNVVYRLGMATSRNAARQLVLHRHFTVNGRIVDISSYRVKPGDVIQVREKSRKKEIFHASVRKVKEGKLLPWFELDKARLSGKFLDMPKREDIPVNINENLIVELYSK
ncbi:MAG TPA: 30S ribosomal protein S4 [Bacteroidetes bacterium]|nr:30S ribosomal protein S4 [Bacteroidota bacterium]